LVGCSAVSKNEDTTCCPPARSRCSAFGLSSVPVAIRSAWLVETSVKEFKMPDTVMMMPVTRPITATTILDSRKPTTWRRCLCRRVGLSLGVTRLVAVAHTVVDLDHIPGMHHHHIAVPRVEPAAYFWSGQPRR